MKKHVMPFLLAVWPYLLVLLILPLAWLPEEALEDFLYQMEMGGSSDVLTTWVSSGLWIFLAVLFIGNVIYALCCKDLTALELARWDFIIKLAHIPVYVVVFLLCMLFVIAIAVPAVLMMVLMIVPMMFLFDLIMMLTSSCYGFRALRKAKQEGLVDKKWARLHTILHWFFVTDVISAFLVWRKLRLAEHTHTEA